jgi:hypothetical protein
LQGFFAAEELKFHKKSIVYAQRTPWKKYKKLKRRTKEGNNCGKITEFREHEKKGSTGQMVLISAKKS